MHKKLIAVIVTVTMACLALVGCSGYKVTPLSNDYKSDTAVKSNGGFVAEFGNYLYFINGIDYSYSDNALGTPVKSALMRVKKSQMFLDDAVFETVVPKLIVSESKKQGFFISGDYVYYATPTTAKNKQGDVMSSYLDITRTKLDGTNTLKRPYFRLSDNSTDYRFVEIESSLYVVYVEGSSLYSYDINAKKVITLAEDMSGHKLPDTLNSQYFYYTKNVKVFADDEDSTQLESFNEVYQVTADGKTNRLILSGLGIDRDANSVLADFKNKKITIVKADDNFLYLTVVEELNDSKTYGAVLDLSKLKFSTDGTDKEEVENFEQAVIVEDADKITSKTIFDKADYLYYAKDGAGIVKYDISKDDSYAILKSTETVTLLFIDGQYLYYYKSGDLGNNVFRLELSLNHNDYEKYDGPNPNIVSQKIGEVEFNSAWYVPEIIGDVLYYANSGELGYNYIFAFELSKINEDEYEPYFMGKRNQTDQEAYQTALEEKQKEEDN